MIALIDADSLLYKAGFSYEEKTTWNELELELGIEKEPITSITSNPIEAKNAIDGLIENIKFKTGCDEVELWLTGGDNFRHKVVDDYKHNRKNSRKPTDFNILWEYIITKYGAKVAYGYEADDVVVYKKTHYPDDYFLCAIDKDVIYQTVGSHYNYGTDELIEVSQKEATRFFYYQILAGDPVDGYKGIPNVGKVKANKILDEVEEDKHNYSIEEVYWDRCIVECMNRMDLDEKEAEQYMITQARLASMHQLKEIGKDVYEVVLFTP
jgi:hypothetical protein